MTKTISIVSPCFNENDNVESCYKAVLALFDNDERLSKYKREHIFVDNNSTDNTVEILKQIAASDENVKIIVNSRNYGPFRSTFNALRFATGDGVVPMFPVDLQDPVEMIPKFVAHWEAGAKRVYGVRVNREEGWLIHSSRKTFYWLVNKLSDVKIPQNVSEFQLIDKQVLEALLQYRDYYPYIRGMLANIGFDQDAVAIPYTWKQRASGLSKNRFFNLLDQAFNGLISFSNFPMRATVFVGFSLSAVSILYSIFQFGYNILFPDVAASGIASLLVAMFFFAGVQLAVLGIIGEYIAAIHFQVRQGDRVFEAELVNLSKEDKKLPDQN